MMQGMSRFKLGILPRLFVAIAVGIVIGLAAPAPVIKALNCFGGTFGQFIRFFVPFIVLGLVAPAIAESVLGFTPERYALVIATYMALDGMGTACNLTGDGAIALVVDKLHRGERHGSAAE